MYYWICMMMAITLEVIGTLTMKYSADIAPLIGLIIMYTLLTFAYAALSIAIKRIPLAVAYGAWESLGLVVITLMSALLFAEPLGLLKMIGMFIIIIGIILLRAGTVKKMS